jgi:hypothetical protein
VYQYRLPAQLQKLLGPVGTHARATAPSHDDGQTGIRGGSDR